MLQTSKTTMWDVTVFYMDFNADGRLTVTWIIAFSVRMWCQTETWLVFYIFKWFHFDDDCYFSQRYIEMEFNCIQLRTSYTILYYTYGVGM